MSGTSTQTPFFNWDCIHRLHSRFSLEARGLVMRPSGPASKRIMSLIGTASDQKGDPHPEPLSNISKSLFVLWDPLHSMHGVAIWPYQHRWALDPTSFVVVWELRLRYGSTL